MILGWEVDEFKFESHGNGTVATTCVLYLVGAEGWRGRCIFLWGVLLLMNNIIHQGLIINGKLWYYVGNTSYLQFILNPTMISSTSFFLNDGLINFISNKWLIYLKYVYYDFSRLPSDNLQSLVDVLSLNWLYTL